MPEWGEASELQEGEGANTLMDETIASMIVQIVTILVSAGVSVVAAYIIAKRYGDVAGSQATIDFEKRRDAARHWTALKALLAQMEHLSSTTAAPASNQSPNRSSTMFW